MMNKLLVVTATLLIGFALCEIDVNNLDLDEVKNQLPPEFGNFDNVNITAKKAEIEATLREKCKKNGHEEAFDEIVASRENIQSCVEQYVNATQITEELEEAKKTGSMDEVFGKYCRKREDILKCVENVLEKVELCLEDKEKENMQMIRNTTETILNFACFKDGDRLALFVAEGGPECITERKEGLQDCANKTLSSRIPKDLSLANMPLLVIGENECRDFDTLQECAVKELEQCKDNTPANIVQAMFKYIRSVTPCKNFAPDQRAATGQRKLDTNAGHTTQIASFFYVIVAFVATKIIF